MVSCKHFVICILLALLKNAASKESEDYSNNAINATTRIPTHIPRTSNSNVTSSSLRSIFPDTDGRNEIETTTKLDKKIRRIITKKLNSTDNFNGESESTIKSEIHVAPTANADKNSENIDIDKNVTTSNKRIFDNLINGSIAETSTTIIDEMTTNSTEKISNNSTTINVIVKCDIQMNNGDPKSVRADICGCADGYEIIEYGEFKNKINKTCVELLPETTTKSEGIKMTVSSEEQKEILTTLLYSTKADYIASTNPKENDNRSTSFSQIHVTTQTDVNNHNTRLAVMAITNVGPDDNWLDDNDATTKPAMPNIATTLSAEARLRNSSDHSTDPNTLENQKVSHDQVGTSSTPYIKLSSLTRRMEKLRANGSQMTYYIVGSALVAAILIASGIHYLRNLRRNGYNEIEQIESIPLL